MCVLQGLPHYTRHQPHNARGLAVVTSDPSLVEAGSFVLGMGEG